MVCPYLCATSLYVRYGEDAEEQLDLVIQTESARYVLYNLSFRVEPDSGEIDSLDCYGCRLYNEFKE